MRSTIKKCHEYASVTRPCRHKSNVYWYTSLFKKIICSYVELQKYFLVLVSKVDFYSELKIMVTLSNYFVWSLQKKVFIKDFILIFIYFNKKGHDGIPSITRRKHHCLEWSVSLFDVYLCLFYQRLCY